MCAPFVFSSNGVSLWWENKRHIYIFHVHFPLQRFWKGVCIYIYHINYGVIQGFPALRKAVTTHVKKYDIFSRVFDIANQLLTRHSPFAPFGQVDEWTAKPSLFSIQGRLSESFRIMAATALKNPYRLQTVTFKPFLEGEENQNTKRKTESYVLSGFGNDISHFCGVSTHFLSWALALTHFTIFIRGLSILSFSFINKSLLFLSARRHCVNVINKLIHEERGKFLKKLWCCVGGRV